jgi:hypothetical protein
MGKSKQDVILEELGYDVDSQRRTYRRAVTQEEKKAVIARLLSLWQTYPELRLGQLIGNFVEGTSLYFIEDYDLVSLLEREYLSSSNVKVLTK